MPLLLLNPLALLLEGQVLLLGQLGLLSVPLPLRDLLVLQQEKPMLLLGLVSFALLLVRMLVQGSPVLLLDRLVPRPLLLVPMLVPTLLLVLLVLLQVGRFCISASLCCGYCFRCRL